MALSKKEMKEWRSLYAKSKRHGISIRRAGPANVVFPQSKRFGGEIYAQLGTGRATEIMDARIDVNNTVAKYKKQHPGWRPRV